MFKLPVCPYCKTVYGYKEVKENKNKIIKCYHCKKSFKRKTKGYLILLSLVIFITIIINVTIFEITPIQEGLIIVSIISLIAVLIYLLLLPFFVSYKIYNNSDKR